MILRNNLSSPQMKASYRSHKLDSMNGTPYAGFPVSVTRPQTRNCGEGEGERFGRNITNMRTQTMSADCKFRQTSPGLMNVSRRVNANQYSDDNSYARAEAIRKYGMQYRRRLVQRFRNENSPKLNIYSRQKESSVNCNFEK